MIIIIYLSIDCYFEKFAKPVIFTFIHRSFFFEKKIDLKTSRLILERRAIDELIFQVS